MAPEVWAKLDYGKPCDVYGFAIILYEIMTTENPFESFDFFRMLIEIQKGTRPEFKSPIPEAYKNLIEKCWNNDPMKRPTFQEIVENLKNDKKFITEEIDEKQYFDYIKYIDEYKSSFNSLNVDIPLHNFIKQKMNFQSKMLLRNNGFYSYHNFMKLDEESKQMVEEAEYDTEKQFTLAQIIIEGQQHFEPNTEVGLKYLKNSIKKGNINSILYYCKLLINGKIIPKNLKKAKKLIDNKLKSFESLYSLMYAKILAKEEKFSESMKYLERSIELGNGEALYKCGKNYYKGIGTSIDKEKAIDFFKKSISKHNLKAMSKYGQILIEDENNKEEGLKYIKKSADLGNLDSLTYYYNFLDKESNANKEEKMSLLKRASYKGDADAMFFLWNFYIKQTRFYSLFEKIE